MTTEIAHLYKTYISQCHHSSSIRPTETALTMASKRHLTSHRPFLISSSESHRINTHKTFHTRENSSPQSPSRTYRFQRSLRCSDKGLPRLFYPKDTAFLQIRFGDNLQSLPISIPHPSHSPVTGSTAVANPCKLRHDQFSIKRLRYRTLEDFTPSRCTNFYRATAQFFLEEYLPRGKTPALVRLPRTGEREKAPLL